MLAIELPPGISLGEYTSLAMEAVKPLGRLCALGECSFRPVNTSEEPSQILFRPPQQGEVQRSNCGLCDCRSRIGGIGNHRLGFSSLPFCETSDHILSGHRLLAHACRRRLHPDDHATVIVHQIVVVVTQSGRSPTL
jgi:hypothetical protein